MSQKILLRRILIFLIPLVLGGTAPIQANPETLLDRVQEITLSNGMKFLLLHRPGAPVFTAYIRVKVGSMDEREGQTGIAHLLEHMAFKGTPEVGTRDYASERVVLEKIEEVHANLLQAKGKEKLRLTEEMNRLTEAAGQYVIKEEFSQIYLRNGGTQLNATTSSDLTSYFVTLPNTKLELWASLESQRLQNPVFREFYSERDVVHEERRTRVDDSPFGKLYEAFIHLAFEKSPYRLPTIGYQVDLGKLSATDLKKFYKKYYVPQNMVVAIVGDVDPDSTTQILQKYFGTIPRGDAPVFFELEEPEPRAEKKISVPFEASPSLIFGYLKPNLPQKDDYFFDVLEQILCEGRTSRLYLRWVDREKLVQNFSCSASTPGSRLPNLFFVYASIRHGHTAQEVLKSFDEEAERILTEGIEAKELKKAKKNLMAQWYFEMQSNADLAGILSYFEAVAGTWKYILKHPKEIESVTDKDIQNVVGRYLQPQRRRAAVLKPMAK